jgi:hypothetical protein
MISWLRESPEPVALVESLADDFSLDGGDMNCVEVEELASVELALALVDALALVCSICIRIERLDPPTPLTDMPNSRVKGTVPVEAGIAASHQAGADVVGNYNARAPPIRRTMCSTTAQKILPCTPPSRDAPWSRPDFSLSPLAGRGSG